MADSNKVYIQALQDFTSSLQNLVDNLVDNAGGDGAAATMEQFFGKNSEWFKLAESISEDVADTKKTSKKSLNNTQKILQEVKAIRKSKEKGLFDKISDPDNKKGMIDGIKSVALIAGAVLAIGMAFKVVGDVDFASVVALSIAMPLIALAISEMSKIKNLSPKNLLMISMAMISGSAALVASSYILADVKPVPVLNVLAASFAVGIAMLAIAFPLSLIGDIDMGEMLMLPIVAVLISYAIVQASAILKDVAPVDLMKIAMGSLAVGIAVIAIAFPLSFIKGFDLKEMIMLPVVAVLIAYAVVYASKILADVAPVDLMNVARGSLAVGIGVLALAIPAWIISKIGLQSMIIGSIGVVVVAAAIMASSLLLSMGSYDKYPAIDWALGVGLSLLAFVPAMIIMGNPAMIAMAIFGAVSMAIVSAAIVATSYILGAGDYSKYPTLDWIGGVALSMLAFIPAMLILGNPLMLLMLPMGMLSLMLVAQSIVDVASILGSGVFTGGPTAEWAEGVGKSLIYFSEALAMATPSAWDFLMGTSLEDKIAGLKNVVTAMVEVAGYLAQNSAPFKNGPPKEWAEGTGLAIKYFSEAMSTIQPSAWDLMVGTDLKAKIDGIKKVVDAMVEVALYLSMMGTAGIFEGGPKKEWAEGTGGAIKAFSEAMGSMGEATGVFTSADDLKDMIAVVVQSMSETAKSLEGVNFSNPIDKAWIEGFDKMISSFIKAGENDSAIEDGIDVLSYMGEEAGDIVKNLEEAFSGKSSMMEYANGIKSMGDAYAHLAKSITNLNKQLAEMQEKSIATLTAVSATVLALSLSDSSNLKDVLEENTGALVEMFKQISESQSAPSAPKTSAPQISKTAAVDSAVEKGYMKGQFDATLKMLTELTKMNASISKMVGNTSEMVDLMSTNKKKDVGIKTK